MYVVRKGLKGCCIMPVLHANSMNFSPQLCTWFFVCFFILSLQSKGTFMMYQNISDNDYEWNAVNAILLNDQPKIH